MRPEVQLAGGIGLGILLRIYHSAVNRAEYEKKRKQEKEKEEYENRLRQEREEQERRSGQREKDLRDDLFKQFYDTLKD